jgi:hypothetical protein
MTDIEQKALIALVLMVDQYLGSDDLVDSNAMRAGEQAIEALARYDLMEVVQTRFGRWTEAGNRFRREKAGIMPSQPANAGIELTSTPKSE